MKGYTAGKGGWPQIQMTARDKAHDSPLSCRVLPFTLIVKEGEVICPSCGIGDRLGFESSSLGCPPLCCGAERDPGVSGNLPSPFRGAQIWASQARIPKLPVLLRGPVACVFHAHRAFNTAFENSCRRFAVINYI